MDIQTSLNLLALISIPIGVFYHIMTLNNTRKNQQLQLETRQAQLFRSLNSEFRSPENARNFSKALSMEWTNYDDFERKYGLRGNPEERVPYSILGSFFEEVGVLLEEGLIDKNLVSQLVGGYIRRYWEKFEPYILEYRERNNYPQYFDKMEYLYQEMKRQRGHQWQ
jgi:hypothetical protein